MTQTPDTLKLIGCMYCGPEGKANDWLKNYDQIYNT